MTFRCLLQGVFAITFTVAGVGQHAPLAATPPMGWNSWDSYGLTITEAQFRANVEVLAKRLKPVGYQYAVVDEGWYLTNPQKAKAEKFDYRMDANGRYVPALNRFPSAEGGVGFKPVAEYVHAQGLRFGIHIIRGIPKEAVAANVAVAGSGFHAADVADTADTCPWNPDNFGVKDSPAGQAWYDSLMTQYAGWGVDFLKVDCIAAHPYKGDEIRMIHKAIAKAATTTGRTMVLSLSPGPAPLDKGAEVAANAQLWRISDDVWDYWVKTDGKNFPQSVKAQFAVLASWVPQVKAGNWPDADMLPVGTLGPVPGHDAPRSTRLNHDEQRTLLTLWSIARSPLIIGANLTELDDWTASLLTNPAVVAMDQRGHEQRLAGQDEDLIAWVSKGDGGREYLALFNVGDAATRVAIPLRRYGFVAEKYAARDVWEGKDLGKVSEAAGEVAAHGVLLLELRR
jgi:alpha-galactosidase